MVGSIVFTIDVGGSTATRFVLAHQIAERLGVERALAGEELIEDQAQGIEIARGRWPPVPEAAPAPCRRACRSTLRRGADGARRPKSVIADFARAVEHHVRRLEVTMQDAPVVRGRQSGAQLPRDVDRLVLGQAADAPQQRGEVLAVDVLHRQEVLAVGFADVVHAADVRMRDLARRCALRCGAASDTPRSCGSDCRQKLQRDGLAEPEVIGAIDLAHAAAAEEADDPIPAVQNRAGRESSSDRSSRTMTTEPLVLGHRLFVVPPPDDEQPILPASSHRPPASSRHRPASSPPLDGIQRVSARRAVPAQVPGSTTDRMGRARRDSRARFKSYREA